MVSYLYCTGLPWGGIFWCGWDYSIFQSILGAWPACYSSSGRPLIFQQCQLTTWPQADKLDNTGLLPTWWMWFSSAGCTTSIQYLSPTGIEAVEIFSTIFLVDVHLREHTPFFYLCCVLRYLGVAISFHRVWLLNSRGAVMAFPLWQQSFTFKRHSQPAVNAPKHYPQFLILHFETTVPDPFQQ